jgi:hypothetical protein
MLAIWLVWRAVHGHRLSQLFSKRYPHEMEKRLYILGNIGLDLSIPDFNLNLNKQIE